MTGCLTMRGNDNPGSRRPQRSVRRREGEEAQKSRQSREGQADHPVARYSEVQSTVRSQDRARDQGRERRAAVADKRSAVRGARTRREVGPSAGWGKALEGRQSSGEDRPSDGELSVVTRTDSQEEQRFEAEESQRSPESFPQTARIENGPEGLRLRLEVRQARSQTELADEETRNRTWRRAALDSRGAGRETTARMRPGRKAGEAAGVGGRTNRMGARAPKGARLSGRGNL